MSEPAWKAGPSRVVTAALERGGGGGGGGGGGEIPPGSSIDWMEAQNPEPPLE